MSPADATDAVVFYWRPGCGFCMSLERGLDRLGIPLDKRNIWDDADHAAAVRSIANGNETVPTLVIGESELVNPSAAQVLEAMMTHTPHLVPEGTEIPEPSRAAGLMNRLLGG
ncbi:MAG: glutaredoxin domain-containing protein [Acidimicrobiales bacterium]